MKQAGLILPAVLLVAVACDRTLPTDATAARLVPGSAVAAKTPTWTVPGDFATIQAAIDNAAVQNGDQIVVGPGTFDGALVTKGVHIVGRGQTLINGGPVHGSGLIQGFRFLTGSDGASLSHLVFNVDLAIMNGEAVDGVTVDHNTFNNTIQAISNWRGNNWLIDHNDIVDLRTRCGGGIGILIGDYAGGTVEDNVVSHNRIMGTIHVSAGDCGGYNGSGIVLYADFRWGGFGSTAITNNRVVHNDITINSDTPAVVDAVAFELTDTRDDGSLTPVTFDNAIGFNDFRGSSIQMALTPSNLDTVNDISRNLGTNRGHGLHPSVFGPGGP